MELWVTWPMEGVPAHGHEMSFKVLSTPNQSVILKIPLESEEPAPGWAHAV